MVKIGDKIRIISDNESYIEYVDKVLIVESIAHNAQEHICYDDAIEGMALVDCKDFPWSLYEYEFKIE